MSRRHTLLMLGLLLAACQTPMPTTPGHKIMASAKPKALATATAAASPLASTGTALVPSATIAPTSAPTSLLTGLAEIDAGYVIAAGGGNVIAAGGGNVIAAGAGNVIAAGAGNVIAAGGGNVIAAGGGNVIAAGGGNVIAAGGGNVIAAGGGNVIAAGGGNYRLLDFASGTSASTTSDCTAPNPSAGTVALGTILPVHGLMIVPVSMLTAQIVGPAVFSDEHGRYQVTVPQALTSNVLLIAGIPGKSADDPVVKDPRLHFDLMVAPQAIASNTIDDDTSTATDYAREAMRDQVAALVTAPAALDASATENVASDARFINLPGAALLQAATKSLQDYVRCANVPKEKLPLLADRFSDILWGSADKITSIATSQSYGTFAPPAGGELALTATAELFAQIREKAAVRWACDRAFFGDSQYFSDDDPAQTEVAGTLPFSSPEDVNRYIMAKYLTGRAYHFDDQLPVLLDAIGLPGKQMKDHFRAIGLSLAAYLGPKLLDPGIQPQLYQAADSYGTAASGTCSISSP